MDSTTELTQGEKGAPRQRRTTHQLAEARVRFWRVVIVTSFFAVFIGGSLLVGGVAMINQMQSQSKANAAAKYKTARISRPMLDGVFCHNLVLDNNSGQSIEDKIERCDAGKVAPKRPGQTQFVWGGK